MKSILLAFLVAGLHLNAIIFETERFAELASHVDEETLVLLDIDDTLLHTAQMLGSDEWFSSRINQYKEEGLSTQESLEKTLAEWEGIRHLTKMVAVEPGANQVLAALQENGVSIIGLTAQELSLSTRTMKQLRANGFDLSLTAICTEPHCISVNGRNILYRNGIIFTSGSSKAQALFAICREIGYTPKRLLLVDDKESHLKDVEQAAQERGIEFIGLRYGYADSKKEAYCPRIAHIQLTQSSLTRLLSDDEARAILESAD